MPKTSRDVPPPLELLCLKALWTLGEGDVKHVRELVAQTRPLAYTTIMTVLDRLVRKGTLTRRKVGRAFVYVPQVERDTLRRVAIRELLDGFFNGGEAELIEFLRGGVQPEPTGHAAAAAAAGASGTVAAEPAPAGEEATIDTVLL
ncbi:MAG TPA: BlaI/MecI/CopY family transcriptional regulator [Candidatus Limnocylindrales bacterium]|nr:BlaI/MecI/CopY family transcriptional regulator [Candidatus Limnocylindrales bacterium]